MTAKNDALSLVASAARSTDHVGRWVKNEVHTSGHFVVNVTAAAGSTATFKVTIEGKAPGSTASYDLLQSPAISAVGVTVLKVGPGLTAVANGAAADVLPSLFRVTSTATGAQTLTYSVGVNLVV